ncbi:protein Z, vitamin K-dependent plasma glycoprotein b [Tautogolabrus adspersus]
MAVGIMSARCRASLLSLCLLGCFLRVLSQGQVFQAPLTHDVFLRSKRANQFLVEEILQGNLERECYEELCNYEEAREYFEDDDKTVSFWTVYYDGDQCQPNPCLHGGNCTDKVGGFICSCPAPHYGQACELGALDDGGRPPTAPQINAAELSECPTEGPTACHQLCMASYHSFVCSCLQGFKLQTDGRTCLPEVEYPCGQLPEDFNTTASICRHGNCPWQVSLLTREGEELCAGVVLGRRSILTSATCLHLESEQVSDLRPSDFLVLAGNRKMVVPVRALYVHNRFRRNHHDNDLALLELARPLSFSPALIHLCLPTRDFCENILMHSGRTGIAKRRGVSRTEELVYMMLDECRSQLNVSHLLSNKMFCMKALNKPSASHNEAQRSLNGHSGNLTGAQGKPDGPLRIQNGSQEGISGHQTQRSQNGGGGTPNRPENLNSKSSKIQNEPSMSDGREQSDVSRRCDGLLPGTPVATVDRGTVFVTGLLMTSSAGCDSGGLVFTKLSRYLNWIRPRVEAAEDHMTPQVSQYPETN